LINLLALAGTMAARTSPGQVSFGTPICIKPPILIGLKFSICQALRLAKLENGDRRADSHYGGGKLPARLSSKKGITHKQYIPCGQDLVFVNRSNL
jgi:hypothetical protein